MDGGAAIRRWPLDGDPDPISAGTAGEAALWGGSSAVVGMAANPFGAHQAVLNDQPSACCLSQEGTFIVKACRLEMLISVLIRRHALRPTSFRGSLHKTWRFQGSTYLASIILK